MDTTKEFLIRKSKCLAPFAKPNIPPPHEKPRLLTRGFVLFFDISTAELSTGRITPYLGIYRPQTLPIFEIKTNWDGSALEVSGSNSFSNTRLLPDNVSGATKARTKSEQHESTGYKRRNKMKDPLLKTYIAEMRRLLKIWRKNTGKRSKDWKPPYSFEEWKTGRNTSSAPEN